MDHKFKIGDKVLVKAGTSIASQFLSGRVCTISTIYHNYNYVRLVEENDLNSSQRTGVWLKELTLVSKTFNDLTINSRYGIFGESNTNCNHEFIEYTGLRESYKFCKKCDLKS